jgi:hypothetical protein
MSSRRASQASSGAYRCAKNRVDEAEKCALQSIATRALHAIRKKSSTKRCVQVALQ